MIARLTGPTSFAPRLALFYVAVFSVVGIYLPFFPLWLEARALTPTQIGIVLAVPMAVRALITPFMVTLGDRAGDRRRITIRYATAACVLLALLFLASGFWQILAVVVFVAVFWDALIPLADAIALSGVRKFGMDYGQVRLWGSVAFIAANIAAGALVSALSGSVVLPVLIVAYCCVVGASVLLPASKIAPETPDSHAPAASAGANPGLSAYAFQHPILLLSLAIGALSQASHAMIYGFGSLYWLQAGFSGLEIGLLWAVGVVAEVLLFAVSKSVLRRFGPSGLLAAGSMAVVLRWILFPVHWSFAGYFVLQILHGATFGAAHLGVMHTISRTVPDAKTGRAQATYFFISGILMAFVTAVSGQIFVRYGVGGFRFMALFGVLGLLLWVLMRCLTKTDTLAP